MLLYSQPSHTKINVIINISAYSRHEEILDTFLYLIEDFLIRSKALFCLRKLNSMHLNTFKITCFIWGPSLTRWTNISHQNPKRGWPHFVWLSSELQWRVQLLLLQTEVSYNDPRALLWRCLNHDILKRRLCRPAGLGARRKPSRRAWGSCWIKRTSGLFCSPCCHCDLDPKKSSKSFEGRMDVQHDNNNGDGIT